MSVVPRGRVLALLLALGGLLLCVATPARAAEVPAADLPVRAEGYALRVQDTDRFAQSFVAGASGVLTSAQLPLNGDGLIHFELREAKSSGAPTTNVLATGRPVSEIPRATTAESWQSNVVGAPTDVRFDRAVYLEEGKRYTMVGLMAREGLGRVFWSTSKSSPSGGPYDGWSEDTFYFEGYERWGARSHNAGMRVLVAPDGEAPHVEVTAPGEGVKVPRGEALDLGFACTDAGGSGLAADGCTATLDGAPVASGAAVDTGSLGGRTLVVSARDRAGNETRRTVNFAVVDVTKPTIAVAAPVEGAEVPRGADVAPEVVCADEPGGSGLAACDAPAKLATGTLGEATLEVTAKDEAGNVATKTVRYRVVDRTKPTVTTTPGDGDEVARSAEPLVPAVRCADEEGGSGIAACEGPASLDVSVLGARSFTVLARDDAGNETRREITIHVVDRTDPTVRVTAPEAGARVARGSDVPTQFACDDEDGGSGIATCEGASRLDTSTLGEQTLTVTATDRAGNSATERVRYEVVDRTDPTVTISAPRPGAEVLLGADVRPEFACADEEGGSGLATCEGPARLDTDTVGPQQLVVTATDRAGNVRRESVEFRVVYAFAGFFSPVNAWPTVNVAKAGSTVPVKFSLGGDQGLAVLADGGPRSQATACDAQTEVDAVEQITTAGEGLTYDRDTQRYQLNWKTQREWAGQCRQLVVELADGTRHRAAFRLR